ncbi:MAG TPA: hypothetical protein VM432_14460 [Bdellovibrionales bacterium]|nr:hypothetical protein [Bdellovibrionales bacterium]
MRARIFLSACLSLAFSVGLGAINDANAAETLSFRRGSSCSLAISGISAAVEAPLELETELPSDPMKREKALAFDGERKVFASERTPQIEQQIAKMQAIQKLRLRLMHQELKERGMRVSSFRLVRSLADEVSAVGFGLYVVFENGVQDLMGSISYQTYGTREETISFRVDVAPRFRKLGVSTFLAAASIEDNPQTERIDSSLTESNILIFQRGLQMGLTPTEALARTPAMKLRRALGYSIDLDLSTVPNSDSDPVLEVIAVRDDLLQ